VDRKKELLMEYRQRKREMGVFLFECAEGGRYIGRADDPKGAINKNVFQLKMGSHPNKRLQKEWSDRGGAAFSVRVLDSLEYDEETKAACAEELAMLFDDWIQKMKDAEVV
jgi:hypothetical protein